MLDEADLVPGTKIGYEDAKGMFQDRFLDELQNINGTTSDHTLTYEQKLAMARENLLEGAVIPVAAAKNTIQTTPQEQAVEAPAETPPAISAAAVEPPLKRFQYKKVFLMSRRPSKFSLKIRQS